MRKAIWIPAVVVVVLAGAAVAAMNVYDHKQRDRIAPGIAIGGIPIGGLKAADAKAKVGNQLHAPLNQDVVITAAGHRYTLAAERLHRRVDVQGLVDEAVRMSHRGGIVHRTLESLKKTPVHANLSIEVDYSKSAVSKVAARVGADLDRAPVDATVTPEASGLKEHDGREGVKVVQSSLKKRLNTALATQRVGISGAVEPAVEKGYQPAEPRHRMADGAKQPVRVTQEKLDGQ